jgi:hypothetical protein
LTGRLKGNITVDPAEKYPSLIDCLDKGENGLMLDLDLPSGGGIGRLKTPFQVKSILQNHPRPHKNQRR